MTRRNIAILAGAAVFIVLFFGFLGAGAYSWWFMGPGMMRWGGFGVGYAWWSILMAIAMLLFWVLVIGGVVFLVAALLGRGQTAPVGTPGSASRPLDILRERYARGEISREEYDQMRRDLES